MTARFRHLTGANPPPPPAQQQTLDSDFVVILAALLCALICVLGLVAVARCAWIRRLSGHASSAAGPPRAAAANKGVKKKVLKSLPKQQYGSGGGEDERLSECAICLTEFAAGEEIRVLPQCGHGFHVTCIDTWLGSHSSCPSCRQILVVARCQRCQKCGGVSESATSPAAGVLQPEPRESHVDRFLP